MGVQVVEIPDFLLGAAYYHVGSGGARSVKTTAVITKQVEVTLPYTAGAVEEADLHFTAGDTGYVHTFDVCISTSNRHTARASRENTISLLSDISGSGTYAIQFRFAGWFTSQKEEGKDYPISISLKDIYLTVRYVSQEEDAPEEIVDLPARTEAPEDSIVLCDGVSRGILAVLHPLSCTVTEEAGGEYGLSMTYPMDDVWRLITPERLIRVPVPHNELQGISIVNPTFWRTKVNTVLYKTIPSYYYKKNNAETTGGSFPYESGKKYVSGMIVTYGGKYYQYIGTVSTQTQAPPSSEWKFIKVEPETGEESSSTTSNYTRVNVPGVKEADVAANVRLIKLGTSSNSAYMKVQTETGKIGHIKIADCEEVQQWTEETVYSIPPRSIHRQYFRIYSTSVSSYDKTVEVNARHISYDLDAMLLGPCVLVEASPQTALAFMQACYINRDFEASTTADVRVIATDIEAGTISQDWSYASPVSALLDPDTGAVDVLKARLYRDDDDFLLLDNGGTNPNYTIRYATNLMGVTVSTDSSELVTRIVPIAKNASKQPYYLPEQYIDSELINRYPVIHYEVLNVDAQIGAKVTPTGGTEKTLTDADVRKMMRDAAAKRFLDDWCDQPKIEIEVEFLMLGDSEEYKQYRGLQSLNLYDIVRVVHPEIGVDINIQVRGYEWDAINRRYISITLGNPFDYGRGTVPGYQIGTRAITERALSPGLKDMIRGGKI